MTVSAFEKQQKYQELKQELTCIMDDFMRTKDNDKTIDYYLKQESKLHDIAVKISTAYYGIPKKLEENNYVMLINQRNNIGYTLLFNLAKEIRNNQN